MEESSLEALDVSGQRIADVDMSTDVRVKLRVTSVKGERRREARVEG